MVTAALRSVFAQESADEILSRWDDLAASLADRFPKPAALMHEAREDVLAFRHQGPLEAFSSGAGRFAFAVLPCEGTAFQRLGITARKPSHCNRSAQFPQGAAR